MFQVYSVKKVGEKKANISPLSFFFFFPLSGRSDFI